MDAARLLQELRELQADAERIVRRTSAILESLDAGEVDSPVRDDRAADLQQTPVYLHPWDDPEWMKGAKEQDKSFIRDWLQNVSLSQLKIRYGLNSPREIATKKYYLKKKYRLNI